MLNRISPSFTKTAHTWQAKLTGKSKKANPSGISKRVKELPIPAPFKWLLKVLLLPITNIWARVIAALFLASMIFGLAWLLKDLPSPHKLTSNENFAVSTQIFDRNGNRLYEIYADENRIPVEIETLPVYVYQASIAIEDQRFYKHWGVDVIGIVRALSNNLQGQPIEGGSTITQQLVKNALLTKERTIQRKAKEAVLAVITEVIYSKEDILEMYLNYISYGGTAVGIESAAQQYFDKPAKDLTLGEASLLAGLPQAPTTYSPFSNPEAAKNRQREVLRRMVEDGFITQEEADQATSEVLQFALKKTDIEAPHFVFYVRDWLYEKYGVETVERGGLRVTTTLDLDIQKAAQASVSAELESLRRHNVGNGAALVTKPNTGEILAMVGSRDYFDEENDGKVNVTIRPRQPGSSIKPLMYALAFQNKTLNPGTVLLDVPTCFSVPGQKPYCPKNYDGSFKGPVTIRQSLGNSLNIPAVKGLYTIGVTNFINQAKDLGITTWNDPSQYGLSLTLGGGEVRMVDLATAFGVLANQGVRVPLTPVLKVENYQGEVLYEVDPENRKAILEEMNLYPDETEIDGLRRVMDRAPAYMTAHIMQDNNARTAAFGPRSQLVIPDQIVSVKTGTTNDIKDNWTIGFTPEYLVATWVGNNDGSPMNPYLVSGVTGAAPIWNDIMSYVLDGKEPIIPDKPASVASAGVCATGFPPQQTSNTSPQGEQSTGQTGQCQVRYEELYWRDGQPSQSTQVTKEIWVKEDTGQPPAPGEEATNLRLETHTIMTDPTIEYYCLDCAQTTSPEGTPNPSYQSRTVPVQ